MEEYDNARLGGMPIGFTMLLAQDREAMNQFAALNKSQQDSLLDYIREAPGDMAKERIEDVIHKLHNQMIG